MQMNKQTAEEILLQSKVLYNKQQIETRIRALAAVISKDIESTNEIPIILTVMNGGLFFAAELLSNIYVPFITDYIHASRYGNETFGAKHITWYHQPSAKNIIDKNVYIIDDILDEGHTLAEIQRLILDMGAKSCKLITLIDKFINKKKPVNADFVGFEAPNHFLFGYGMDIYGIFRQLPEIYIYSQQ